MPHIISLRELNNPSRISKLCHDSDTPIFVTKNGVSDMVILSSDAYDNLSYKRPMNYTFKPEPAQCLAEPSTLSEYMSVRDAKPLYSIAEIKETLRPIFSQYAVKKAILFGSYVKGTADSRSDIDLLVETDLKGLKFYGLLGAVSEALRFPVDLIDKSQVKQGSDIYEEIDRTGVTIYG